VAPAAPRQVLRGHVPLAAHKLAAVDRLPGSLQLNLAVGLPLRNEAALTNLLEQLYDPSSPLYHRYLTPQEFTERFGPTEQDYQRLVRFVRAKGLRVEREHSNRVVLDVSGAVSDIETAFATNLRVYPHPKENRRFFAPEAEPSVEQGVSVLDISGLDNYLQPHPTSLRSIRDSGQAVPNAGSAPGGSYRGNDFRAAYTPGVALSGSGQVVGLLEFDGYYANDITTYESQAGLPSVPLQNVLLNGSNGNPGANNVEVALDIEVAISIAPGLSSVMIYEGTTANTMLNQMAMDNRAKQVSSSWTFGINATTENIFRQFGTQGQSMFQASGDDGAYSGEVPTPADDPNVTVVGGTTLTTTGPGGAWISETTWNWSVSGMGTNASGGGVSTAYAIPSYQKGVDMSNNQGSTSQRNLPDVAMTADNIWVVWDKGSKGAFGGTSAATPLWAAFMALVNQQSVANGRSTVGLLNSALYPIGKGTAYSSCFHDITTGNNSNPGSPTKFTAVAGYDLCTGWGTPAGQPLINALAGGTNLPPKFNNNPFTAPAANAGQPYSGSISNQASDLNAGDPLRFAKLSGPSWLSVGSDGALSGTPAGTDAGTNAFTVSVTESAGMSNTATMFTHVNGAPVFTSNPFTEPNARAGQLYSGSISANARDPNPGDALIFTKVNGPSWLTIAPSGAISGTPANSDAGTNTFMVSATDSGGLSASATLYINVTAAPAFVSNPFSTPAVSVGQSYSGSITNQATDPNPGAALTFAKVSGPAWLLVATDGSLSGTPAETDIGTNIFSVSVTDSAGLASSATMNVPVMSVTPNLQIALQTNAVVLTWTGGNPPFQIQASTNLSGIWQNVGGLVSNHSVSVLPKGTWGAYRVQAAH
jgi:pro-kumamolisin-like protein/putative Ig domain-containing protein